MTKPLIAYIALDESGEMVLSTIAESRDLVHRKLISFWGERDYTALGWRVVEVGVVVSPSELASAPKPSYRSSSMP